MTNKVIHIDFTKNKKNQTFLSLLKNTFKKVLNSPDKPTDPDNTRKIIYYRKGIS